MMVIKFPTLKPFHLDSVSLLPKLPSIDYISKRWENKCPTEKKGLMPAVDSSCEKKPAPKPLPNPCILDSSIPQPKVLIVGAGLAGLSAASHLANCGFNNFLIVEATDRPGGRIHSCWLGDEVGELGAGWINGATVANPLYSLGAQEGLLKDPMAYRYEPSTTKIPHLASDGRSIDNFITLPAVNLFKKINQQAFSLFSMDNDKGQGSLNDFFQKRLNEQLVSVPADWRNDTSRVVWGLINQLKSRWGTRIQNISSDMYGSRIQFPGNPLRIPVGLVGILGPLLKNISASQIRYCSPVNEIKWRGWPPRVTLKLCDESIEGDYVILTTSLGVLKNQMENWFQPKLPEWKKNAIKNLGYGKMTRLIIEYKKPFWMFGEGLMRLCWSEKELSFRDSWTKGIAEIEDLPGATNRLVTTIGGKESEMLENCSEDDIAEELTRVIRQFTGNPSIPFPTGIVTSKWNSSPFFFGGNSFLAQGSTINDQCSLGTPVPGPDSPGPPVILFAGEATAPGHISTLVGAHLSGIREADRVLKLTKKYGGPPPEEVTN